MENDSTTNGNNDTSGELTPGSTNVHTNRQTNKSKTPKGKSSEQQKQKWSLWRHWKSATRKQQFIWVCEGIGGLVAISTLGMYILGFLQTKRNFKAEHRPRVVISRPPQLLGTISCEVTENAIHLQTGAMHIWVKNIRGGDAVGAFVVGPQFKLVPEKKVGNPFYDDVPRITDQTCKQVVPPQMKAFPINAGQEVRVDMTGGVSTTSLIDTTSITIGQEPEPPPGQKFTRTVIAKDAIFELYAPVCVYYFDEDGERYGSCSTFRLVVNGRIGEPDNYGFSCTESPITGTFEGTLFGFCEN